jgi:hypothetical protein
MVTKDVSAERRNSTWRKLGHDGISVVQILRKIPAKNNSSYGNEKSWLLYVVCLIFFFRIFMFKFKVVCLFHYMKVCKILLFCTATNNIGLYILKQFLMYHSCVGLLDVNTADLIRLHVQGCAVYLHIRLLLKTGVNKTSLLLQAGGWNVIEWFSFRVHHSVLYDPSPREARFLRLYPQIERVCPPLTCGRAASYAAHFDITALRLRWSLAILWCLNGSQNQIRCRRYWSSG